MRSHEPILTLALGLALAACRGGGGSAPEDAGVAGDGDTREIAHPPEEETATPPAQEGPRGDRRLDTYAGGERAPLPACEHLDAGNLVGDATDEVICVSGDTMTIYGADRDGFRPRLSVAGGGLLNAIWIGDRDGDGLDEVVAGFGMGRGHTRASIRVLEIDAEPAGAAWWVRTLYEASTGRSQVTSIWGPDLYLAHFVDQYTVTGGFLSAEGSLVEERRIHMGMNRVYGDLDGDGQVELAVGRIYGDQPRSDGDLTVYDREHRIPVPTERGVRSLVAADLDGDGTVELVFGDGWHFKYRDEGRGRLNVARHGGDGYVTDLVAELPGQFAVMKIRVRDLDGDGQLEILAGGSDHLFLARRQGALSSARWSVQDLGPCGINGEAAAVRRADGTFAVAVAGDPVRWIDLEQLSDEFKQEAGVKPEIPGR